MAEAVAEPPAAEPLPNPVIKDSFEPAKSAFRQARIDEGLDAPPEPTAPETPEPTKTTTEPTKEPAKPIAILPDDVLSPVKDEPAKPSDTIAAIEAMELPKGAKEKTVAGFQELKTKSIKTISELESKIKGFEDKLSKATSSTEIEALQAKAKAAEEKAAQIEDQWAKVAFEQSPRFQARYGKAEKDALDSAKSYLEGTEIDPRIIDLAAHNTGRKRLDLLSEAGADDKLVAAITSHLATYDLIQKDKQSALENWREEGTRWQAEEQQRIESEANKRKANEDRVWNDALNKNANLLPFRKSKDEQWNTQSEKFISDAKDVYNGAGAGVEDMAEIVQLGVIARSGFYENIIKTLTDRVKSQDTEISSLKSARPGGTITTVNGQVPTQDDSKLSRDDLSKKTFNEQAAITRGT